MVEVERRSSLRSELWIARHAQAGSGNGLDDHDRPLTPRGQRQAEAVGATIAGWGRQVAPTRILCSTALRARQTLEGMGAALDGIRGDFESDLYLASAGEILAVLQAGEIRSAGERVLVIGHNPGLSDLALGLADTADRSHADELERLERMLPTAALCRLQLPESAVFSALAPGSCRILEYFVPDVPKH